MRHPGRTPSTGVLFHFWLLALALALAPMASAQTLEAEDNDRVIEVIDGRTVILERLGTARLIGLHVPAIHEPLGADARDQLRALTLNQPLRVLMESVREDASGVLLVHGFLADGRNVQELLLEQGLALADADPPNLYYLTRFTRAEQRARAESRGLWGIRHFNPVAAERLSGRHSGYRLVRGRISRVHSGERFVYLNVGERFAVMVTASDWIRYFDQAPEAYLERSIVVRGTVARYRHGLHIQVAHPAMIEFEDATQ